MPKYFVLIGPSGAGKSTVIEYLLKKPLFELSVSYTTRKPRPNEQDGVHYFFISEQEFQQKINEKFFLEFTEFNGSLYGTPFQNEDPDKIIIFDIEIDGFKFVQKTAPRSFFCLLKINKEVLEKRLKKRMLKCLELESEFKGVEIDEITEFNHKKEFNQKEFERRLETFELYEKIEKEFDFNFIIDNSFKIEKTFKQIDELADKVIEHFKIDN
jgi:guanylate kinase